MDWVQYSFTKKEIRTGFLFAPAEAARCLRLLSTSTAKIVVASSNSNAATMPPAIAPTGTLLPSELLLGLRSESSEASPMPFGAASGTPVDGEEPGVSEVDGADSVSGSSGVEVGGDCCGVDESVVLAAADAAAFGAAASEELVAGGSGVGLEGLVGGGMEVLVEAGLSYSS